MYINYYVICMFELYKVPEMGVEGMKDFCFLILGGVGVVCCHMLKAISVCVSCSYRVEDKLLQPVSVVSWFFLRLVGG